MLPDRIGGTETSASARRLNDRQPRCVRGTRARHPLRHEAARPPGLRRHRAAARRGVRAAAHLAARRARRNPRRRDRAVDPHARHRPELPARRARAAARAHRHRHRRARTALLHPLLQRRRAGARALRGAAARIRGRHVRPRHRRRRLHPVHVLGSHERALVPAHRPLHRPQREPWCGTAGPHRDDVRRARDARRPRHPLGRGRHDVARRAHREPGHRRRGRVGDRPHPRGRDLEERPRAVPLLASRPRWPRRPP